MNHCIYLTLGAQAGTTSACAQPSQMPEPQWTFRNRLLNEEGEIKEGFPEEMAFELRLELESHLTREGGRMGHGGARLRNLETHTVSRLASRKRPSWILFCHKRSVWDR